MAFFDITIPSDNEPVRLGAGRIRDVKSALNPVIAKIFDDSGNFLTKWVTTSQIADNAIQSLQISDGAVSTDELAAGALSADTTGRAIMADGFITQAKLDSGFTLPNSNVNTAQLADGAVTTAKIADAAVTFAKIASGASTRLTLGSFTGNVAQVIGFSPTMLILLRDNSNEILIGYTAGVTASNHVHAAWDNGSIITSADIQWDASGFTPTGSFYTSVSFHYLALG